MGKIRLAAPLQTDSIVDGSGLRIVIWTQGCPHACVGCHNPESHDYNAGIIYDIDQIIIEINKVDYHTGITFSGGEPMVQAKSCALLAKYAKSIGLNIWCYTGYTLETLLEKNDSSINEFLNYIDILVDGKFDINQKSLDLKFKGSKNQRIIDVQKTLNIKEIVLMQI